MSYLGLDVAAATEAGAQLRSRAVQLSDVVSTVTQAETIAAMETGVATVFDEVIGDLRLVAAALSDAVDKMATFALDRFGGAVSPRWSDLEMAASHNTYSVPGGIGAVFANGLHTFELDIHRGAPTRLGRPNSLWGSVIDLVIDASHHAGGRSDDWRVYHHSLDTGSEYDYFSTGLEAVAQLDATFPITVFVDNKDGFAHRHSAALFDARLVEAFGDRLFRPQDLLDRAPGSRSLRQAVELAGWPTVLELSNRVIVVLTDEVDGYPRLDGAAFVATPPTFVTAASAIHLPEPNVVIHNQDVAEITPDQIEAIRMTGTLVRTYGNPVCGQSAATYRAADYGAEPMSCGGD